MKKHLLYWVALLLNSCTYGYDSNSTDGHNNDVKGTSLHLFTNNSSEKNDIFNKESFHLNDKEGVNFNRTSSGQKNYLSEPLNTLSDIKIYFDNSNINSSNNAEYVIRQAKTNDPLHYSIDAYLKGVNKQEENLGFKTNTLGIDSFKVKIEDRTAKINFHASDLNIEDAEQILNFNYNINQTVEQFNNISDIEICVNSIYNYQMAFLANEEPIACPFSF